MICLDSTYLIDLLRNKKEAVDKANEIEDEQLSTSTISVYEVLLGIRLMKSNMGGHKEKFKELLHSLDVLGLDLKSSVIASKIAADLTFKGQMIEQLDCLIAGTMLAKNTNKILTQNKDHFKRIKGIEVLSY